MSTTKSYSRKNIPENITIPWGEIKPVYTDHALSRMTERTQGSMAILPKMVVINERTLKQIWVEDGILKSMLVELPYTRGILLQLILSPESIVITLHFRETWRRTLARCAESQASVSIAGSINLERLSDTAQSARLWFPKKSKRA